MALYTYQGIEQTSNSFEPFPAGEYTLVVVEANPSAFNSGNGHKVDLKMEVVEGQYKGRTLYEMIALEHPNADWAAKTQAKLDAICKAAQVRSIDSWDQLINVTVKAKIYIEKSKDPQYSDKNKIDMVLGSASSAPAAAQSMQRPTMAAPAPAPAPLPLVPAGPDSHDSFNDDIPF